MGIFVGPAITAKTDVGTVAWMGVSGLVSTLTGPKNGRFGGPRDVNRGRSLLLLIKLSLIIRLESFTFIFRL